jgi:hypothetical protein
MKGQHTMATKAEQRRTAIKAFLESNGEPCSLDDIVSGCQMPVAEVGRALAALDRSGDVINAEPGPDGNPRWVLKVPDQQDEADNIGPDTNTAEDTTEEATSAGTQEDSAPVASETEGTAVETPETDSAESGAPAEPVTVAEDAAATEPADDVADEAASTDSGAEGGNDAEADDAGEAAEPEPESTEEEEEEEAEPEPVDPDPAVLLIAAQLAVMDGPVTLEQVALAAFRIAAPKTVETTLHVLCALAEHGAVECSTPYRPDDRGRDEKAEWTVTVDAAELDRIAAIAQLADAPASVECPTCGSETELPHLKGHGRKPVGPGGKKRTGLASGELRDMLIVLIKENPGEELKPNDFVTELRNDPRFKDRISDNPSGAVRSALSGMTDPAKGGWVTDLGIQPLTYRCRGAK